MAVVNALLSIVDPSVIGIIGLLIDAVEVDNQAENGWCNANACFSAISMNLVDTAAASY
jgi:hypothetical protein